MGTTEESWWVDSTELATLAFNVESKASRLTVAPVKGDNVTVPYRAGRDWREKRPDERLISLSMWVRGMNADGTVPADQVEKFNENWDSLVRLFYRPWEQYDLIRQTRMASGLLVATAQAEFASGLEADPFSETGALFSVALRLADPFFYGAEEEFTISPGGSDTLDNAGHDILHRIIIELAGPLTNPVVENATRGHSFTYDGTIASGETLMVNVWEGTAVIGGTSFIGNVTPSGHPLMFSALPGVNAVSLTADSGAGTARVRWTPNYI